ncbi:MAG: GTP cyclohydrolase I FolE [Planctomycetota bacterium]
MRELIQALLAQIGEDPERPGLRMTAERVERSLRFLTAGYRQDPAEILARGVISAECDEMVVVKDIELYSLCEHHMLPFFGRAHVAYIPDKMIVGLSKVARVVVVFSKRLQVQERLTTQIAEALVTGLEPKGVGVIIDAAHLCMMMRGVQKQNSVTVTSCVRGRFRSDARTRAEFMRLAGH